MLRLKLLQSKLPIRALVRPRFTQAPKYTLKATISTSTTAAVATQQQKRRYFSSVWKTSAALATTALTYGLLSNHVLALEANDCNVAFFFMKKIHRTLLTCFHYSSRGFNLSSYCPQ